MLEASLRNGVPHAHVCGGRGRCSTCRIRIAQSTAIGDPVNVASRLQGLTESLGCEVLMSEEVYVRFGVTGGDPMGCG